MSAPGWQQPAVPPKPIGCLHLGALFAALTVAQHDVGHEWVCPCGKRFVVVRVTENGRQVKALRPKSVMP